MTELLAPAGGMPQLKAALRYGADAVYGGAKRFGLRAFAGNFSMDELAEAVRLCHEKGKKFYITLNVLPFDEDMDDTEEADEDEEHDETESLEDSGEAEENDELSEDEAEDEELSMAM